MSPQPRTRSNVPAAAPASRAVWMLLGVVLAAHLTVAWVSHDGVIQDDAEGYVLLGRNLAAGHGYVFEPGRLPTSWRAPGYPFFLAVLFWLTDGSLAAARVASALLWTVTALLTYLLARRLTGQSSALFAAALAGLSPELVGLTGLLWSETLFTCLFLAAVWAMARWRTDRPSWWAAAAIGGLIGAAALTRSTAVILVPVLWFCAITSQVPATRRARAGLLAKAGLATTLGMVVVGAWSMRNFNEHGHFILVESNVGFNLYLGHSHDTPMPFAWRKASRLDQDRVYLEIVGDASHESRNRELARAAIEQMREDPLRAFLLAKSKAFDFWLPDFFIARNIRSGSFGRAYSDAWLPVLAVTVSLYVVIVGTALAYAWRNRRQWSVWFLVLVLALYTAPHMLVFGVSRHHLPLMPLLMMLAAPWLHEACRAVTNLSPRLWPGRAARP